ncbi:SMP-30/gluconolactonase/LRE family protein [Paraglaciecola aquimarina]|uniref:SMP-30/gluconolactonase/LRE family protein n=1 Tax=Paraglaciecola aquimarina TaxID=1235557 RepID=A0ABU3T2G9_9ALTE|nr:SMP-30/gluconolactonase/LRE family protein [Paraglaciecola aquimarina]MDU0356460.1 SMP-30/gluconolactonase/LRE family protein [Paraglaciecola aquimarina]
MIQSIALTHQLPVANTLGEGVIWDHNSQTTYWTDIQNNVLYSWKFAATSVQQYPCPERLGCFGFTSEHGWLICAFETGFAFFHPISGQTEWIAKIESDLLHTRLNDGRVDRQGRFWAGTMMQDEGVDESKHKAALYRLEHDKSVTRVIDQVKVSNGLCWSPKGDVMYFADSPTQTISQSRLDILTGEIGPLTDFAHTNNEVFPDGSCVDSEGCIWNAQWGSSTVKRYSPEGKVLLVLDTPCLQPTCVAFGGPNLQHLIVTSARQNINSVHINAEPANGDVFVFQTPYTGLQESICTLSRSI